MSREQRIERAKLLAPKGAVQEREGLLLGHLVTVNADMMKLAEEDSAAQCARIAELEKVHERDLRILTDYQQRFQEESDALMVARRERDEAQQAFSDHTIAVSAFLSDIYGILIDPLVDGVRTVKETCDEIRIAAKQSREDFQELAVLRLRVQEGEADTKRLDGLMKIAKESFWARVEIHYSVEDGWSVVVPDVSAETIYTAATGRAAIDTAREKK